jgi:DNA-binding NarL/FixJ family response regulator
MINLKVQQNCINKVKLSLRRNGFGSQRSLAEDIGLDLVTVSNFLTGKSVDHTTFEEICRRLALDWREIADLDFEVSSESIGKNPQIPEFFDDTQEISALYPNGIYVHHLDKPKVSLQEQRDMIRILVVDDHHLVREGIKNVLSADPTIEVVGMASNGFEAIEQVAHLKPDLMLIDIEMPTLDGISATKIINEKFPEVKILFLSTFDDSKYLTKSLKLKISGYILKGVSPDELKQNIFLAHRGYSQFSPGLLQKVQEETEINNSAEIVTKLKRLTNRELDVVKLMVKGYSNKEISILLFISQKTVKNYITNIFAHLEIKDRQKIVDMAALDLEILKI